MSGPNRNEIISLADSGGLIKSILADQWGFIYGKEQEEFVGLLVFLHTEGLIDLLSALNDQDFVLLEGWQQSRGVLFLREALGKLNISAKTLLSALEILDEGDSVPSLSREAVECWCGSDDKRSEELLALHKEDVTYYSKFCILSTALGAAIKVGHLRFMSAAYEYLRSGDVSEKKEVVWAFYGISLPDLGKWRELITAIDKALQLNAGEELSHAIVRTVFSWFKTAPKDIIPELEALIATSWMPSSPGHLEEASRALAFEFDQLGEQFRIDLLLKLQYVDFKIINIHVLDLVLERFIKKSYTILVREFVESFLVRSNFEFHLAHFDSVVRQLNSGLSSDLESWVFAWLRSGNFQLCKELDEGLFGTHEHQHIFDIDLSQHNFSEQEYGFIARKSVVAFFLKPKTIASMIISLARHASPSVRDDLQDLLFSAVLINYPSLAGSMLDAKAEDQNELAADVIKVALGQLQSYLQGVRKRANIMELRPSEREYQLEWQRHSDEMNDAMREARRGSFLSNLVTERLILHGNGMVSWIQANPSDVNTDQGISTSTRIETPMASFSHSMEMPRQMVLDPVGLDRMLLTFINERSPK
ncbi:hypothetical protein [Pseudomonas fragariae (ex Marin et al. 2024)]|uniref:hypothetical protein n=1 Tax=Pseudomonas fragariae (ex Marin et al. 2024) TaxID=3080056 RepID=UPI003F7AF115